jgi:hypothetical protein
VIDPEEESEEVTLEIQDSILGAGSESEPEDAEP